MRLTELEKKVFKSVCYGAYDDCGNNVKDICKDISESLPTVKGAISSLTKKGLVENYFNHDSVKPEWQRVVLPIFSNNEFLNGQWYICDQLSREEFDQLVDQIIDTNKTTTDN